MSHPAARGAPAEIWALSYADRRSGVNALRGLRRRPWRALLWVVWIVIIGILVWVRSRGPHPGRVALWQLAIEDVWVCGAAIGFGLLLALGAARFTGFFRSRAEALVLVRAPLSPPLVAAYLQLRAAALTLVQTFGRFAYLIVIGIPSHTTPVGLVREAALLAAATVALASVPLPRSLARGAAKAACIAGGWTIVAVAALPLVRDALLVLVNTPQARALAARLPAVHPGSAIDATAAGDPVPTLAALAVAAVAFAAFVAASRDAYPELYALSLQRLDWLARVAARRGVHGDDTDPAAPRTLAGRRGVPRWLHGAAAFVWLDAVAWMRRAEPSGIAIVAAVALGAGIGAGLFARAADSDIATATLFTSLPNLYVAIASTGSIRLAAELRRPLFWLGGAPLAARLAAWAFAPLWRDASIVALLAVGYFAISRDLVTTGALLAGGAATGLISRAVGLAVFAILPHALEQRGPAVFLRLLLAYALVAPVAIVAIIAAALAHSLLAGALIAMVPAVVEAGLLTGFSAWRLAGRVDRLAGA